MEDLDQAIFEYIQNFNQEEKDEIIIFLIKYNLMMESFSFNIATEYERMLKNLTLITNSNGYRIFQDLYKKMSNQEREDNN